MAALLHKLNLILIYSKVQFSYITVAEKYFKAGTFHFVRLMTNRCFKWALYVIKKVCNYVPVYLFPFTAGNCQLQAAVCVTKCSSHDKLTFR